MARELAKNPTVLVVNDTLFAHGGVLKRHGTMQLEHRMFMLSCVAGAVPSAHSGWTKPMQESEKSVYCMLVCALTVSGERYMPVC